MDHELFIALDVLEFIERLPRKTRLGLRAGIAEIGENPSALSDATEYDSQGRMIEITIVGDYALVYWIDAADRHVKILDIHSADR
jgi:mRNA-degrading endonuclease RelE of RelBE toxin-antitoxin system